MKLFDSVQIRKPKMSKFDLTHERKLSMNMGTLVPIMCEEIIPGDKFRVSSETFVRMAPMLAPMMHRVNVFVHYFFVPNRLVWDSWQDFITGGRDGLSAPIAPVIQMDNTVTAAQAGEGSLLDHMGLPPYTPGAVVTVPQVNALPFRAYQLIYNEYYRDQNLEADLAIDKSSGIVGSTERTKLLTLRQRAWEKDYFTSALPWAQRGAAVTVPINGTGSATYNSVSNVLTSAGASANLNTFVTTGGSGQLNVNANNVPSGGTAGRIENIASINLANANLIANDLRTSFKIQEWLEKNARGGARYVEQILAHFGVRTPDYRLQRPEYLGGGKTPLQISEVLSTYQTTAENIPQGNMAGHGVGLGESNTFSQFFPEHGWVIGIMSVLPNTAYQQGIPKKFTRPTKLDYAFPEFANLGEQQVLTRELYWTPATTAGEYTEVFGYQSRFSEYKYANSTTHGAFRSSLNFWHMNRIFASKPTLQTSFVQADPTFRVFAVTTPTVDHLYVSCLNKVSAIRPLPYYGTPMF